MNDSKELATLEQVHQPASGSMVEVAASRQAQEVQAAMIIAKRFPRNHIDAHARIMKACKRLALAEQAMYSYPKGGKRITGPSIRLAEELARSWGNIDFGVVEMDQRDGESDVMAYCWDLETNTRQTKVFTVKHERHTNERTYALTDPREIYEMVANQGARRLRACILGIVPGDVTDEAVSACEATLKEGGGKPIAARTKAMAAAYDGMGVSREALEAKLGHKLEVTTETELVTLRQTYQGIRDGMQSVEAAFPQASNAPAEDSPPAGKIQVGKLKKAAEPEEPPPDQPDTDGPATASDKMRLELLIAARIQKVDAKPIMENMKKVVKWLAQTDDEQAIKNATHGQMDNWYDTCKAMTEEECKKALAGHIS